MVKNTYTFLFLETVVVEPAPKKVISSAKPNNVARASITSNMHQFNSVSSVPTVYTAVSTDANIETLIRANDIIRVDYLKKQDAFVEQKRGLEDRIKHLSEQKLAVEKKHRDQINAMKEKHQHLMMTKQSEFETKLTKMEQAYNAMENRYKRDAQARDENFAVQLDQTRSNVMAAMQAEKNGLIQQINDLTEAINAGEADKKQRIDNLVKANEKTIAKCKGVMAERDRYAKLFKENKENCSTITEAEKKAYIDHISALEETIEMQKEQLLEEQQQVASLAKEIGSSVNLETYQRLERERDRYLQLAQKKIESHDLVAAIETKEEMIFNLTHRVKMQDAVIASYSKKAEADHNYARH